MKRGGERRHVFVAFFVVAFVFVAFLFVDEESVVEFHGLDNRKRIELYSFHV